VDDAVADPSDGLLMDFGVCDGLLIAFAPQMGWSNHAT